MWGSPELDIFISRLIMDSRDGTRQGLPVQLGAELLFLAKTNKIVRAIDLALAQKMPLKEALECVEEGDQKRLGIDAMDNPLVSRDTVARVREVRGQPVAGEHRPAGRDASRPEGSPVFWTLIKAAAFLLGLALLLKLFWPYVSKLLGR